MNISALTDPNPKPYLDLNCHDINCNDISCNVLTANNIINNGAVSSSFSAYSNGNATISAGGSVTNLCNLFEISNPNFNLSTNVFTAPVTGNYLVNFAFSVTNTGTSQHINLTYSYASI